jgi:hypothetical protein
MREKNPVPLMDSVNAMDIMEYSHQRLKQTGENPKRLAEIKEQERRHRWALRKHIDGSFDYEDEAEPVRKKSKSKSKRRSK